MIGAFAGLLSIGFGAVTARLPLGVSRGLGRGLGRVAYYVVPRMRRVGFANLDRAYGAALTRAEKRRILKHAARNMGIVAGEFARIPRLATAEVERHITFEGLDQLDTSRGAVLISGHLGNWEWLAPALASRGFRVAEVVRPLDNPRLNAFVDHVRQSGGIGTIPKARAGGEILRLLKEGVMVGLLVDQSPRENAVPCRFFGAKTWATIGPAMAAARVRVPVHAVSLTRDARGHYTFRVEAEIAMARSGDPRADLLENTQRCQDAIERLVRACPEQWLWFHRRWKPRPRLAQEWDARNAGRRGPDEPDGDVSTR